MVIVYVKLGTDNAKPYALLLPEALPQLVAVGAVCATGCLLYTSPSPRDS